MKDNNFRTVIAKPCSILLLGAAPALAAAADVKSGMMIALMSVDLLLILTLLSMALRNVIVSPLRLPIFLLLAVGVCSGARMLMHAFLPGCYETLGIYTTVLGLVCAFFAVAQAESDVSFGKGMLNALKAAALYIVAVLLTSLVCELFGSGTVNGTEVAFASGIKNAILTQPAGRILVYGLVAGVCGLFCRKKEEA